MWSAENPMLTPGLDSRYFVSSDIMLVITLPLSAPGPSSSSTSAQMTNSLPINIRLAAPLAPPRQAVQSGI